MNSIYSEIRNQRIKQALSQVNYSLFSMYRTKDTRGERDNPLPYEATYAALAIQVFSDEFKAHLKNIIESGLFDRTFEVSYWMNANPEAVEEMTSMLVDLLNRPFGAEWAIELRPEIEQMVRELYTASATVGRQMVGVPDFEDLVFNIVDKRTIDQLGNIGVLWITEGATRHIVTDSVTVLAREAIETGMGLREAGELFKNELAGVAIGKSDVYYRNLASVVMNRARNFARINQFYRLGVTECELLGIPDALQCDRCAVLDGTVWSVEQLYSTVENVVNASTPEEVISATPFINSFDKSANEFVLSNGNRVAADAETAVLASTGITLPLHGNCRCSWIIRSY